jgi:hypothetical protein
VCPWSREREIIKMAGGLTGVWPSDDRRDGGGVLCRPLTLEVYLAVSLQGRTACSTLALLSSGSDSSLVLTW